MINRLGGWRFDGPRLYATHNLTRFPSCPAMPLPGERCSPSFRKLLRRCSRHDTGTCAWALGGGDLGAMSKYMWAGCVLCASCRRLPSTPPSDSKRATAVRYNDSLARLRQAYSPLMKGRNEYFPGRGARRAGATQHRCHPAPNSGVSNHLPSRGDRPRGGDWRCDSGGSNATKRS